MANDAANTTGRVFGRGVGVGRPNAAAPLDASAWSSAWMTSDACCGRLAGSFSRHRRMSSTSGIGASGRAADRSGGVSVICAASRAAGVRPANGGLPANSSYANVPNE